MSTQTGEGQREPALIRADPRLLARRLDEVSPAAHGLSRQRWRNIRSLLRAALALLQPVAPGRHRNPLAPDWKALWNRLETRRLKTALSRFCHFGSEAGLDPASVDEAVMEQFAAYLDTSLLKSPAAVLRETCGCWNRACQEIPDWPGKPLTVWMRTDLYSLPWTTFPESLHADVRGWLDRLAGRDLLDDVPLRAVRPTTLALREYQLRQFASALVCQGCDPASLKSLADLVEIDTLKTGLRFFLKRSGGKSTRGTAEIGHTLQAMARHWAKLPPEQLERIAAVVRKLHVPNHGLTETNRARLRAFDDPAAVRALLGLPQHLLNLAHRTRLPRRAALLVQDALAIELLLMAPIRISNLVGLDIERHLLCPGQSRMHLVLAGHEVKNREPLDYPLPPGTVALYACYVAEHRPRLAPAGSTALFPGRHGGPKDRHPFGARISRTVFEHTGLRVHPHLFRHIGAKLYLAAEPGGYEVVRRVLGHRSMQTTRNFYTGLESAAAVRHFDKTILGLRSAGGA